MNAVEEASSPTSPAIVVGGGLLALGFAAIAVWGFVTAEPAPAPRTPPIAVGEDAAVMVPAVAPAPVVEETEAEVMVRAKEAGPLLRVRLLDLDGDRGVRLADAFVPRTITVVNVWATWCAPCIREFLEFNRLAAGWGDSVRFLPVEVVPSDRQKRDALVTEHRQQMPRASVQLGDLTAGAVQDALRELALPNLSELAGAGVPITPARTMATINPIRFIVLHPAVQPPLPSAPSTGAAKSRGNSDLHSPLPSPGRMSP